MVVQLNQQKVIFRFLKEIKKYKKEPRRVYGLTREEFGLIFEILVNENLITNATVT